MFHFYYEEYDGIIYILGEASVPGQTTALKSSSSRILSAVTYWTSVVILAGYSASFVSYLTVIHPIVPFSTFHELLEKRTYRLGLLQYSSLMPYFQVGVKMKIQRSSKWHLLHPQIIDWVRINLIFFCFPFSKQTYKADGIAKIPRLVFGWYSVQIEARLLAVIFELVLDFSHFPPSRDCHDYLLPHTRFFTSHSLIITFSAHSPYRPTYNATLKTINC